MIRTNDTKALENSLSECPAISQKELDECLSSAMGEGSLDMIRMLLQHGAKLQRLSFIRLNARADPAVFQLLMDYGFEINTTEFYMTTLV